MNTWVVGKCWPVNFLGTLTISDGLQNIREYLDQDGAILSGHQEFITYFALPFVSEPHVHPSFKHLFEVTNYTHSIKTNTIECNYNT